MSFRLTLFLAFSLAMDAFAVSVTNGICYRWSGTFKTAIRCGLTFGFFQAAMPLIGYLAGYSFYPAVRSAGHWIAFLLLSIIGGRMTIDAVRDMRHPQKKAPTIGFSSRLLLMQAFATSVDALAVGVGLAALGENLPLIAATIGIVTFLACFSGVLIGRLFGDKLSGKAQLLGGVILVLIGLRIAAEHTLVFAHG